MSRDEEPQMRSRAIAALTDSGTGDENASIRAYGVQALAIGGGPKRWGIYGRPFGTPMPRFGSWQSRVWIQRIRGSLCFTGWTPNNGKQVKGHGSRGG